MKGINAYCVPQGCHFMRQGECHLPPLPFLQLWAPATYFVLAAVLASHLTGLIQLTNPAQN